MKLIIAFSTILLLNITLLTRLRYVILEKTPLINTSLSFLNPLHVMKWTPNCFSFTIANPFTLGLNLKAYFTISLHQLNMLYLCSLYISLTETVSNLSFILVFDISVFIYNFFMNVIISALCIAVDIYFTFSQFICICQCQCSHYHSIVTSQKCDNNK